MPKVIETQGAIPVANPMKAKTKYRKVSKAKMPVNIGGVLGQFLNRGK